MKIKLSDISNFIEGNWKYYKNKVRMSPEYIVEQVQYRLYLCKDDCLVANKCKHCPCPPKKKSWVNKSCNGGERFPDIMNKVEWEKFKAKHNIEIDKLKND